MLEIYIRGDKENGFLDLKQGTLLEIEAITDLFDDLSVSEFSLPVEIPWTENNRRLLSFSERVENFSNEKRYWACDVFDNGWPELVNAKITLLEKSGKFNYASGTFNATISGAKGLFGSAIKNKTLRNIDWGDDITWAAGDSREFAEDVMKGLYPQYPQISFAPVVIQNFFDETKNYNGEFLAKDTVNNIISTGGGADDWIFGRPQSANPALPTAPGDPEHIDFRTIPFFKFQYVLKKVFENSGYTFTGDILTNPALANVHMFNSTAIEFYSNTVYQDYNRKIVPAEHMPDIKIKDFFIKVFSGFNIYPVFTSITQIELKYRTNIFANRKVLDITHRCPDFAGTYTDDADNNGFSLEYGWDDKDDYRSDRLKDLTTKTFVGTVATAPNLQDLDIGRPFTTDDYAFVEAENMYYNLANGLVLPTLWDAWSERLDTYKSGNGDKVVNIGIGTLCTYVELDEPNALYVRRNKLGASMTGSYWNNRYVKMKNDFGLTLMFISKQLIAGNNVPVSYNHNISPAGTILESFSLAIEGPKGLLKTYHEEWQVAVQKNESIRVTAKADKKFMQELDEYNTLQINNVLFLFNKIKKQIPLQQTIDIELVPL